VLPNELRDISALAVLTLRGGARILGFSRLRVKEGVSETDRHRKKLKDGT
jgi:hypothetical protein